MMTASPHIYPARLTWLTISVEWDHRRLAAMEPAARGRSSHGRHAMGKRVKGKVVIVTGAGSIGPGWGNGKAAAVLYAREGARVLAVDLTRDAAEETKSIIASEGGTCSVYVGDVAKQGDVKAMVATCVAAYGRVDVL